ncbi:hypothetical protein F2Q69_00029696 [Brassica cretica]|uniref:Uncharacterized protein n=1 Tax=Brassica cretica TaxID=69181 RepID=A0A8S9RTW0_BRACR|nr:hypothetical protein F2Q69_00029696 [Brassica cretica]
MLMFAASDSSRSPQLLVRSPQLLVSKHNCQLAPRSILNLDQVIQSELIELRGHDILVFRSYDLTGAFPRTAVRPDDPIQDRGHDKRHSPAATL